MTLSDMSGEELESKFLDLVPHARVSEFRLELRRRLELVGRIEGRHLVALRNAVHATMPEGELCGDDALEAWPDKLRERAEKAEAERDTLNNALDSICAEFPEYGHTSGHEAAVARCVELINKLKVERDQARAERDGFEVRYKDLRETSRQISNALAFNTGRAETMEEQLSTARTALTRIMEDNEPGCGCNHSDENCCARHETVICSFCYASVALAALNPPEATTSEQAGAKSAETVTEPRKYK